MNIIYLHQYFTTPNMSGGTRSYEMAKRLVAWGHQVEMITSYTTPNDHKSWFTENIDGINVHWYPNEYNNKMSFRRRITSFLKFAKAATLKVSSFKDADVIFASSTPLTIAIPAVAASKYLKIPLVFEVRDLWPEVPIAMGVLQKPHHIFLAKALEKWAYNNSEHIIALSPGMKEGIVKAGNNDNNISIIPNSADNSLFEVDESEYQTFLEQNTWLPKGKVLIYTGTFGLVNNVISTVDIALELKRRKSDISILLVGDGIQFDQVVEKAEKENVLNETIYIRSKVPKHEIPFYLKYAKIASSFAIDLPAIQANSANKFFDALAASKPVLINYGGWQKDIIESNSCGVVAWRKPASEVVDELENLLNDDEKYKQACINAKNLAVNDFSRDKLAKQLENILIKSCYE